jgi:hypothetical protein
MRHAPVIGAAQKETELVPKSNRMPERSLGVKVDTPNCRASTFPGASKKRGPLRGPSFQRGRVAGIRGNSFWRRSGDRTDRSEVLENIESEEVPSGATSLSTTGLSICRTKLGSKRGPNPPLSEHIQNHGVGVIQPGTHRDRDHFTVRCEVQKTALRQQGKAGSLAGFQSFKVSKFQSSRNLDRGLAQANSLQKGKAPFRKGAFTNQQNL